MGIFSKSSKQSKPQTGTTVINNGTTLKGMIDTKGSIFIDGRFEGIIIATQDVTIGKNGEVLGEIKSKVPKIIFPYIDQTSDSDRTLI